MAAAAKMDSIPEGEDASNSNELPDEPPKVDDMDTTENQSNTGSETAKNDPTAADIAKFTYRLNSNRVSKTDSDRDIVQPILGLLDLIYSIDAKANFSSSTSTDLSWIPIAQVKAIQQVTDFTAFFDVHGIQWGHHDSKTELSLRINTHLPHHELLSQIRKSAKDQYGLTVFHNPLPEPRMELIAIVLNKNPRLTHRDQIKHQLEARVKTITGVDAKLIVTQGKKKHDDAHVPVLYLRCAKSQHKAITAALQNHKAKNPLEDAFHLLFSKDKNQAAALDRHVLRCNNTTATPVVGLDATDLKHNHPEVWKALQGLRKHGKIVIFDIETSTEANKAYLLHSKHVLATEVIAFAQEALAQFSQIDSSPVSPDFAVGARRPCNGSNDTDTVVSELSDDDFIYSLDGTPAVTTKSVSSKRSKSQSRPAYFTMDSLTFSQVVKSGSPTVHSNASTDASTIASLEQSLQETTEKLTATQAKLSRATQLHSREATRHREETLKLTSEMTMQKAEMAKMTEQMTKLDLDTNTKLNNVTMALQSFQQQQAHSQQLLTDKDDQILALTQEVYVLQETLAKDVSTILFQDDDEGYATADDDDDDHDADHDDDSDADVHHDDDDDNDDDDDDDDPDHLLTLPLIANCGKHQAANSPNPKQPRQRQRL